MPVNITEADIQLLDRLKRHPQLRARMESLLGVVEDVAGDVEKADAAERRVIEELRHLGHEVLTAWAERSVEKNMATAEVESGIRCGGKKTPLAHDFWRDHDHGAAVAGRHAD